MPLPTPSLPESGYIPLTIELLPRAGHLPAVVIPTTESNHPIDKAWDACMNGKRAGLVATLARTVVRGVFRLERRLIMAGSPPDSKLRSVCRSLRMFVERLFRSYASIHA